MTAHFPMSMFFSQLGARLLLAPTSLLYLPAQAFFFFLFFLWTNAGGLSVVLLRDEFSAEIPGQEKGKRVGPTPKGLPWQLVCVVKNTAGV